MNGSCGRRAVLAVFVIACVVTASPATWAQSVAFQGSVNGVERAARVTVEHVGGVEYVALTRLIDGLGGAYEVQPRKMTVDFAGTRAFVQVNDKRVNGLSIFTLSQPIQRVGDEMLIARADVPTFFQEGFRVAVDEGGPAGAPAELDAITPQARRANTDPALAEPLGFETLTNQTAERVARTGTLRPAPFGDRPVNVIVIDPGHGGRDTGVSGRAGSVEKDVTLAVSLALRDALASKVDAQVQLTREQDIYLSLPERAVLAATANADLLLTIHVGGSPSSEARGAAIFYPPAKGTSVARYSITEAGAPPVRRYRDVGEQSRDIATKVADALEGDEALSLRGVYAAPCRLLNHVGVPGLLIEVGAATNADDESILMDEAALKRIAEHIAEGVVQYLNSTT